MNDAIYFADWLRNNTIGDGSPKLMLIADKIRYTTEELYRLYLGEKEHILCAAIWFNNGNYQYPNQPDNIHQGFVITGRRHDNCYQTMANIMNLDPDLNLTINQVVEKCISIMNEEDRKIHQGFITNLNRYVDRKEAWKIAKQANQIVYGLKASENGEDSILISENLY